VWFNYFDITRAVAPSSPRLYLAGIRYGRSAEAIEEVRMTEHELDVSIVLPVYNEAGHLQDEIDRIRKAMDDSPYTYEIIVVDDGSTDGSGSDWLRSTGSA
jgi:cellulose synthase/poly-beta-1,6-N-acetylglucosamine synthase-like glycosyltransferase